MVFVQSVDVVTLVVNAADFVSGRARKTLN